MIAFCYASGQIGFARDLPEGALPIIKGKAKDVRDKIEGNARLAYDGKTWLVPGIPEAADDIAALDALERFIKWIGGDKLDVIGLLSTNMRNEEIRREAQS